MAKSYSYKENRTVTKKLIGMYDAEKHTIDIDGEAKDIITEMKDFEGSVVEVVVKIKEENDLSDDE